MNIRLLVVAKTDMSFVQEGIDLYIQRLRHYANFEIEVVPALKELRNASPEDIKKREAALLRKRLEGTDRIILLDEHGQEHSSVGFAQYMQKQMNSGIRSLTFVVGGAFGFAPDIYQMAHDKIALSQMTFNHQMVRLFFVEQLYRAFTILHHEPYHNE